MKTDPVIQDLNRYMRRLEEDDALADFAEKQDPCDCGGEWDAEVWGCEEIMLTCRECGETRKIFTGRDYDDYDD